MVILGIYNKSNKVFILAMVDGLKLVIQKHFFLLLILHTICAIGNTTIKMGCSSLVK